MYGTQHNYGVYISPESQSLLDNSGNMIDTHVVQFPMEKLIEVSRHLHAQHNHKQRLDDTAQKNVTQRTTADPSSARIIPLYTVGEHIHHITHQPVSYRSLAKHPNPGVHKLWLLYNSFWYYYSFILQLSHFS